MNDSYETETVEGGYKVHVLFDPEPMNPRTEYDNAATFVAWHGRRDLGDVNVPRGEYNSIEELIRATVPKGSFVQPVWAYEHGGITVSTSSVDNANPFSCPWDSGQVGFIYMSRDKVRETMCVPRNSPIAKLAEHAGEIMNAEIAEYANYLEGQVFGYVVESPEGDEIDSCWGFIGEPSYAMEEGKNMAKYEHEQFVAKCEKAERETLEQLARYAAIVG